MTPGDAKTTERTQPELRKNKQCWNEAKQNAALSSLQWKSMAKDAYERKLGHTEADYSAAVFGCSSLKSSSDSVWLTGWDGRRMISTND